jgi:alkylation response protein AidB-like acyl-CoA dehydrogenase
MNYGLTEDQASILAGLDQLLGAQAPETPTTPVVSFYDPGLDAAIAEAGFLDIAREEGFGPLDGALIVERLARLPCALEAATSAIVAPALNVPAGLRPLAVAAAPTAAARYLPYAQGLLFERGEEVVLVHVDPAKVQPVDSLFAYPYGKLETLDGLEQEVVGDAATFRRRWRVGLATEAAGCTAAALAQVVEHVKTRFAFGRPLGSFQAIQHRLAMAAETTEAVKWLAFRAAWSDTEADAATAAGFAQARTAQLTYDLHQFSGAMGLTLEFPLHLWTYRLRALAGELGGASHQSRAAAAAAWPDAA